MPSPKNVAAILLVAILAASIASLLQSQHISHNGFLHPKIAVDSSASNVPCDGYVGALQSLSDQHSHIDPGEINQLRRALALDNPSCYDSHFSTFANLFKTRISTVKNHMFLHIPKAGGTSICSLAKESGKQVETSGNNCWEKTHFYPLWCCFKFEDRPEWPSCEVLNEKLPEFVMNENYLDYPLCMQNRMYSTLIRDPIDRAMSHELHLGNFPNVKDTYPTRLALGQHNYFTWAMTSGSTMNRGNKTSFIPLPQHLELAMDTLSRFDFLLELSLNNTCDTSILNFMGFGNHTEEPHKNSSAVLNPHEMLSRETYNEWNLLDKELFLYARRLMEVDCEFFVRLNKEEEVKDST